MMTALPLTSPFDPIAPRNRRSSIIAAELRRLIHNGQLKPGDQLPTEACLCKQFGVSRTTLREAIQMLRTSGLLEVTPGRGSFIRTPDLSQLLADLSLTAPALQAMGPEIANMRALLQRDALTKIGKTQPAQRGELHRFTLNKASTAEQNAEAEANWHLHMAKLSGSMLTHLLLQILLSMEQQSRTKRFANPDEVLRTMQIQMRINTALVEGDLALAERVLMQYLAPGGSTFNTASPQQIPSQAA